MLAQGGARSRKIAAVATFAGGSAWAMARDIAEGFVLVTERTYQRFDAGQLDKLGFELERGLRDMRGEAVDIEDVQAVQQKNRKLSRLTSAITMLRSHQQRRFRGGGRPQFDGNA